MFEGCNTLNFIKCVHGCLNDKLGMTHWRNLLLYPQNVETFFV